MASRRAELRAALSLDNSKFVRGIKQSIQFAKDLAKQFAKAPIRTTMLAGLLTSRAAIKGMATGLRELGNVAGTVVRAGFKAAQYGAVALGAAITAASTFIAIGVKNAYALGAELFDASNKTGIAVDQLMILQQAAKENGIDDITGSVKKMQKSLVDAVKEGTGPAAQAFSLLGLQAQELVDMSPADALQVIGERINEIQNPALRTAEAMAIFGKEGAKMLPLFANSGALGEAAKNIGAQAGILRDNAEKFHQVSVRLSSIGLKLQGFFVGIAEKILPLMEIVTSKLASLDLAGTGEKFGEGIRVGVGILMAAFNDPSLVTGPLISGLKAGFAEAGNLLVAAIVTASDVLTDGSFWAALVLGFEGVAEVIGGSLMEHFKSATQVLQDLMEFAIGKGIARWEQLVDKVTPGGSKEKNEQLSRVSKGRFDEKDQQWHFNPINERMYGTARTYEQVRAANKGNENSVGKDTIEDGRKKIETAGRAAMDTLRDAKASAKVPDIFGAGKASNEARIGFEKLHQVGLKTVDKLERLIAIQTPMHLRPHRYGGIMPLSTGHLTTGHLSTSSYGATDFISARERAKLQEGSRAEYMALHGGQTPDGVTRHGDRKRMQEFQKNKEKDQFGLDKTNELLGGIKGATTGLASAWGVKEASE